MIRVIEEKITVYGKWKRWDKKWKTVLEFESEIILKILVWLNGKDNERLLSVI